MVVTRTSNSRDRDRGGIMVHIGSEREQDGTDKTGLDRTSKSTVKGLCTQGEQCSKLTGHTRLR